MRWTSISWGHGCSWMDMTPTTTPPPPPAPAIFRHMSSAQACFSGQLCSVVSDCPEPPGWAVQGGHLGLPEPVQGRGWDRSGSLNYTWESSRFPGRAAALCSAPHLHREGSNRTPSGGVSAVAHSTWHGPSAC